MEKTKNSNKIYAIICTLCVVIFLCISTLSMLFISNNYQSIYKTPHNINAVMDLDGFSLNDVRIDATTNGKWEFFYNKWIVTDSLNEDSDYLIDVPSRWTGKTINGKKLGKAGFASYRFTVLNPEVGSELVVKLQTFSIAYRTFINNQLTCQNGTLSKTSKSSFVSGLPVLSPYKVTDSAPLIIVLEISYNSSGGLFLSPWLNDASRTLPAVWNFMPLVPIFAAGMMLTFIIFTLILNLGLSRKDKNISFIFLILFFFMHLLTTKEVFWQIGHYVIKWGIGYALVYELNFLTAFVTMFCFFANALLQGALSFNKRSIYIILSVFSMCIILFYSLYGTAFQIIPIALGILVFCYIFYRIMSVSQTRLRNKLFPASILSLLLFTFLLEAMDNLGYVVFGLEPGISIISFILIVLISVSSFMKVRDAGKDLIKATVLEKEVQDVKHQALKAQVKPHFMFNLMSSIQALYRKDINAGEEALTDFATHLRQNIDADNKDTIPFPQEIKNIMNYVELENLRLDKKLTLILDIDHSEFEIPVLSLQPLIENAIKYAGTEKQPDGFIKLLSKLENGFIIIQVIDNGRGFNIDNIRENAAGLKNTRERFKYLLNAELTIESVIDKGTTVTITIPAKEGKSENNSNR